MGLNSVPSPSVKSFFSVVSLVAFLPFVAVCRRSASDPFPYLSFPCLPQYSPFSSAEITAMPQSI
jgi:hypothetical protein